MRHHEEPLSLGTEDIVRHLRDTGWHRYAVFVQRMGEDVKYANVRYAALLEKYNALVARYEPQERRVNSPVWTGD